ncbi:hypothetical protein Tco_0507809 [Tanacetum coccineum]
MQSSSNQIRIHFLNPDKSLQFRPIEVSESESLSLDHIHGDDKNVEDVQMADHLRLMEEQLQIPIIGIEDAIVVPAVLANEFELKIELLDFITGRNLMSKNTQEALTIIENKAKVRTFRNKPQVSSDGGTSTQIDAIAALTKQVKALGYHIASMQETNNRSQEATIQLMQNQMGQLEEAFQERPLETPPLSAPKPKEDPKPNHHQPSIPYPYRLQEENFQALENPTGRADHFVYRIDIVDSLCDKFPIENNSLMTLLEETDTLLYYFIDSSPDYETFCFDIEEKSSGSTTSHYDLSLLEYESFPFDLSIDQLPLADRSDSQHEEFAD